jgi:Tfp pilus assembly protein PilN
MASPNELSFLPDDYLERKAQRRTNAICAVLFLIVMVAIGSAFSFTERAVRSVEGEHAAVEKEFTEAAKRIELVQQLQDKQKRMAQQADLAASLLEKVPRSYILADVTNALPVGVSLLEVKLESKQRGNAPAAAASTAGKTAFERKRADKKEKADAAQAAANQPKLYDVAIRLSGVAQTDVQVAQFISRLNQSSVLMDVNLIVSEEHKADKSEDPLRKFELEARLNPTAEVTPETATKHGTAAVEIKEN